jgi:hypothetical protein
MKLALAVVMLTLIGCSNPEKKGNVSLQGTFKMKYQRLKNDKTDTTYSSRKQMKIFTEDYMMYANINSPDSLSSFGIGPYSFEKDTISEYVIYSASDTIKTENPGTYKLIINKTDKGFIQVIPNILTGGKYYELTEEYESIGNDVKSSLDGVWKKVKVTQIKGKDTTTITSDVQYKIYYAGYVIWGNTWTDSLNKNHTGIGFGKFEMNGKNKLKESMMESSYYTVRGREFNIDIEMNGDDNYNQTINNADGSKSIEYYERLKKK